MRPNIKTIGTLEKYGSGDGLSVSHGWFKGWEVDYDNSSFPALSGFPVTLWFGYSKVELVRIYISKNDDSYLNSYIEKIEAIVGFLNNFDDVPFEIHAVILSYKFNMSYSHQLVDFLKKLILMDKLQAAFELINLEGSCNIHIPYFVRIELITNWFLHGSLFGKDSSIKMVFRNSSLIFHPDKGGNTEDYIFLMDAYKKSLSWNLK